MKSKISQATKKSISLLLAILMMFSMLTVGLTVTVNAAIEGVSVLYFSDQEGTWSQNNSTFKLKCYKSDGTSVDYRFTKIENTSDPIVYKATLDSSVAYDKMVLWRCTSDYSEERDPTKEITSIPEGKNYIVKTSSWWNNWYPGSTSSGDRWDFYQEDTNPTTVPPSSESSSESSTEATETTTAPTSALSKLFFYQNSGGDKLEQRHFTAMEPTDKGTFKIDTTFPINNEFKLVSSNNTDTKVEDSSEYCVTKRTGFSAEKVSFSDSLKTAGASVTVNNWSNIVFNKNNSTATNFVVEYTPEGDTGLDGTIKIWTNNEYPGGNTDPTESTSESTTAPPTTDPTPTNPTLAKPKLTGTSFVLPGDTATVSVSNIKDDYATITGVTVTFDFTVKEDGAAFTGFTKTEDGKGITFKPATGKTYSVTATASAEGYTTSAATKTPFTVKVAIVPFAEADRIYAYAATLENGAKPVFNAWTAVESDVAAKNVYKNYNNGQYDAASIPTLGATTDKDLRVFLPTGSSATQVVLYNSFSTDITIDKVTIAPGAYKTVDYIPYDGTDNTKLKVTVGSDTKYIKVYRSEAQGALYINNTGDYASSTDMLTQLYRGKEEGKIEGGCSGAIVTRDLLPNNVDKVKVADVTVKKIKGRGNSTWRSTDKKSFNVNFNENLDGRFLNEGFKGKKYSLLANFKDPSLSRNKILYALGDDMGDKVGAKYSPDVATIDLYMNGLYMGNYLMCQKVDVGSKELINDLGNTLFEDLYGEFANALENTNEIRTNGFSFLMELDTNAGTGDFYFRVNHGGFDQTLTIKEPEYLNEKDSSMYQDALTTAIEGFVTEKYKALIDALDGNGNLSDIIDVDSLARYMMLNELAKNFDIGVSSTYFVYNKAAGKFYASPVWDLDVSTGNCDKADSGNYLEYEGNWVSNAEGKTGNKFMQKVFNNATVKDAVKKFWTVKFYNELVNKIDALADAAKTDAKGSFENNYVKWTSANGFQGEYSDNVKNKSSLTTATYTNGSYTKANTDTQYKSDTNTYSNSEITNSQIDYVADWLKSRAAWLTSQYATGSDPSDPTKPTDPSKPSQNYFYAYWNGSSAVYRPMEPSKDSSGTYSYTYEFTANDAQFEDPVYKLKITNKDDITTGDDKNMDRPSECVNFNSPTVQVSTSLNDLASNIYIQNDRWANLQLPSNVFEKDTSGSQTLVVQYTPGTENALAGTIKIWTKADYKASKPVATEYTFTYNYNEYDTTTGMAYDSTKALTPKTFTKTVSVAGDEAAVKAAYIANAPKLTNNYFAYSFDKASVKVNGNTVEATAEATAKTYTVTVKDAGGLTLEGVTGTETEYNYQAVVTLTAPNTMQKPVWKNGKTVLAIGKEYKFRITGNMTLTCVDDATVTELSTATVVNAPTYELYIKQETNTERIRFNYLVENFNTIGATEYGVLYFVTDVADKDKTYTNDELKAVFTEGYTGNIKTKNMTKYNNNQGKYIFSASLENKPEYEGKYVSVYSYVKNSDGTYTFSVAKQVGSIAGSGINSNTNG